MKFTLPFFGVIKMSEYAWIAIVVIGIFLILELIIGILKKRRKKQYLSPEKNPTKSKNNENYLIYYRKNQILGTIRVSIIVVGIGILLAQWAQNIWSFFAVWLWAIILAFQPLIQSMIVYFSVLIQYKAWETVRVDDKQWEIISIKPLFLGISGMNDNGEHDGRFYLIPNKVIFEHGIEKISLRPKDIQKVVMIFSYNKNIFWLSFDDMLFQLETFLTDRLPQRSMAEVGYFKSYSGHRYKLNFDFTTEKEGTVLVTISFLEKLGKMREIKREIVSFLERIKK